MWKVILATLVIFGAGVITGGLLVNYSDRTLNRPVHEVPAAGNRLPVAESQRVSAEAEPTPVRENRIPAPMSILLRKNFLNRLNRELKLNPDQHERIEKIVGEGQERTKELWRGQWVETKERIRAELGPDQQTRFEELLKSRPRDPRRTAPPPDRPAANLPPPAGASRTNL